MKRNCPNPVERENDNFIPNCYGDMCFTCPWWHMPYRVSGEYCGWYNCSLPPRDEENKERGTQT